MKPLIKYIIVFCVFSINAYILSAQPDFSGTWILDHGKSDAEFRDYHITCTITQKDTTFTVEQVLVTKNGEKSSMPAITYNLNGKEEIKEEQEGKSRLLATWSTPDQKTIKIQYIRNIAGTQVGSITIYKLSENEQFLTIRSSDLKGDSPMVQVYKKK